MSQNSCGISKSALRRGTRKQKHIVQPHIGAPTNNMISYNNNSSSNSNMTAGAEPSGNTYIIANDATVDQATSLSIQNTHTGTMPKLGKNSKQQLPRKPPPTIDTFWPTVLQEVQNAVIDSKHQSLPLARIKKIMKLDENAKMIAAEAPTLFAKACEFFIQELTMRAWIHTDESKRRTLQRSDIAQAIANYDQFDFLIDIVPREDIKPSNHRRHHNDNSSLSNNVTSANTTTNNSTMTTVSNAVTGEILNVTSLPVEGLSTATAQQTAATISATINQSQPTQVLTTNHAAPQLQIIQQPQQHLQYFITLPGQQAGQAQLVHQLQLQQQQQINNGLSAATPLTTASLNLVAQQPQQLILTTASPTAAQAANVVQQQQQTALLQNIAQQQQHSQQHQPQQQLQLLQQVMVTPSGEITSMPIAINSNQLNLLRLQMQQQQQQQQVIIPTHLLTAQQLLQLQAAQNHAQANTTATAHIIHQAQPQQQTQQQQHSQNTSATNNIYINSNNVATNQPTTPSMVSTDRNLGSTFRNSC